MLPDHFITGTAGIWLTSMPMIKFEQQLKRHAQVFENMQLGCIADDFTGATDLDEEHLSNPA